MRRTRFENREYINRYRFAQKVAKMKQAHKLCHKCFSKEADTLHHKDENHSNCRDENLQPVCRYCHIDIVHQSDKPQTQTPQMPQKCPELTKKAVLQPTLRERYGFGGNVIYFQKGNLVVKTQVSLRVQHLFEEWGFLRA